MISWVIWILLITLVVFALLSPLESVRWWADRGEAELRRTLAQLPREVVPVEDGARAHLVYLSGVGDVGGNRLMERESSWLAALAEALPDVTVVSDVFPYSVDNRGLLQRATVGLWSWLDRGRRARRLKVLHFLINLRNVVHVLVSADPRYGPAHNIGLAQEIWRSLQRHGYRPGSGRPVVLVGYSGGAQMSLGAAWFLSLAGIPVSVISIGGVFGDEPGLDRIEHLWHLTGAQDRVQLIGPIVFSGRWPGALLSSWGRAKREGRVSLLTIGGMRHDGGEGYFGRRARGADGRTHAETTRDAVVAILSAFGQDGDHSTAVG